MTSAELQARIAADLSGFNDPLFADMEMVMQSAIEALNCEAMEAFAAGGKLITLPATERYAQTQLRVWYDEETACHDDRTAAPEKLKLPIPLVVCLPIGAGVADTPNNRVANYTLEALHRLWPDRMLIAIGNPDGSPEGTVLEQRSHLEAVAAGDPAPLLGVVQFLHDQNIDTIHIAGSSCGAYLGVALAHLAGEVDIAVDAFAALEPPVYPLHPREPVSTLPLRFLAGYGATMRQPNRLAVPGVFKNILSEVQLGRFALSLLSEATQAIITGLTQNNFTHHMALALAYQPKMKVTLAGGEHSLITHLGALQVAADGLNALYDDRVRVASTGRHGHEICVYPPLLLMIAAAALTCHEVPIMAQASRLLPQDPSPTTNLSRIASVASKL